MNPNKNEMVHDALQTLIVAHRKSELEANLQHYLQNKQALQEAVDAVDAVEARMPVTIEALEKVKE